MSEIADVVTAGWFPLRHHASVDAALRYVSMACLVRSDAGGGAAGSLKFGRDQYGRIREVDGSAGDFQGGLIWEALNPVVPFNRSQLVNRPGPPPPRDFPSLGFVFPATVQPPAAPDGSGMPRVATGDGSGLPSTTTTDADGAGGAPPALPTTVSLLPIQSGGSLPGFLAAPEDTMLADDRYKPLTASCAPGVPVATTGLVVAAMHERRMEPLFFPTGPLKAVNRDGDPATASLVFEGNASNQADPAIYARIHSAWRVTRIKDASVPALMQAADVSGQLAWQIGAAGLDGLAGFGLAYDNSGGATTTAPSSTAGPDDSSDDGDEDDSANNGSGVPQTVSPPASSTTSQTTGSGIPQTQSGPAPTTQSKSGVVGAFGWGMGGFLDAGGPGCQHMIGTTHDGETIYAGHARTSALFRSNGFDGPLNFEDFVATKAQVQTGASNRKRRAHLCWNPDLTHNFNGVDKIGKWWFYAEDPLIAFQIDSGTNPYTAHQIDPVTHAAITGGIKTTKLTEMNNSSSVMAGTNVYAVKENADDYVFVQGGGGASQIAFQIVSLIGSGIYNAFQIDPVTGAAITPGGITTARLQEINLSNNLGVGTNVWCQAAVSGGNTYYVTQLPLAPCT